MQPMISTFVMVIFGATGDLTARKLMPALYSLLEQGILPDRFFVVGVARREFTHESFRELMKETVIKELRSKNLELRIWEKLKKNLYYQQGFFEDKEPYEKLVDLLSSFDKEIAACITRFFYLATPPQNYSQILKHLSSSKLSEGCGQGSSKWTRVLIEKPFGKDQETARLLEEQLARTFEDRQIYRIDHYLAKETIQNILAFRFANRFVEDIWNNKHIDNVQITLFEAGGIGNRGKFYEGVGALRDAVQNHLMAMLSYTTMEEPASFTASDIRGERVKVLSKLRCIEKEEVKNLVVRGQYGAGMVGGRQVAGYREEKDVAFDSLTETYVALKLFIDNDCWSGVPFYLRTGKRMSKSAVQIDVQFKNPQSKLYREFKLTSDEHANVLTIRVQPKEGISLKFFAKAPGLTYNLSPVNMDFSYLTSFKRDITDSYEKLLIDAMVGDQTLFATSAGFGHTWEFVTKILKGWEKQPPPKFPNYEAGSAGPKEADELIERDGRRWLL
ncbi:glucose-6-phosphate dehydrogenase [Candidatus Gottesmanbacteria bacterium]|nr:glucose-6-phosphate dehydrogenase [Candidatus Gottesmanbacteria bacterium]